MDNLDIGRSENKLGKLGELLLFGRLGNGSVGQAFVMWLAVSVWSFYMVSGTILVVLFFVMFLCKETRRAWLSDKLWITLTSLISGLSVFSSLLSRNIDGLRIASGLFVITSLGGCAKALMTEETFRKSDVFCGYGSIIAFITAVIQNFIIFGHNPDYRPTAGVFNANYYGTVAVMTSILCLVRLIGYCNENDGAVWYRPKKLFYIVVLACNVLGILICESRSSLMTLMVTFFLLLFISKKYKICAVVAVLGAAVWGIGWFFPDLFSWTNSLSFIIGERSRIWRDALKSYIGSPVSVLIGRGPMTYRMVAIKEGLYYADHAHNLVIDMLINVGAVGMAIYAAIFAYFVKMMLLSRKNGNKMAFVMTAVLLCEVLFQGIFDTTVMWHQTSMLFLVLLDYNNVRSAEKTI